MSNKENKMEQIKYVIKNLSTIKTCTVLNNISLDINKISTPIVKDVLDNKFKNGSDMNAVVCMFDNLFLSTAQKNENGMFVLSVHVSKWVKNLKQLNVNSTSGYVYFSDILSDVRVLIKLPQEDTEYIELITEYFIGMAEINKLRYTVPNFVYTLGAFFCPMENGELCKGDTDKSIPFVIFEKIPGKNMQEMLENDKLTFPQYLGIFIQVLLALEVAQRTISFTHFDFHTANLMCRTISNDCKYSVPLDNKLYEVTASKYLPVIIDFGLSTVKHEGNIVGSYTFPEHGMKHHMLPGVDIFKFLYYSISYSSENIQRQISNLMSFYGKDDPYKVLIGGDKMINKATNEYVKKGSYSRVTTQTPLDFLNWILEQPEYNKIVSVYMKKTDRNIYFPLSFSTTIQTYNSIFKHAKEGRDKAIKQVSTCITSKSSYIMSKYSLYVLSGYNNTLSSKQLKQDIKKMKADIKQSRTEMITNDYRMLFEYRKLVLPDIIQIKDGSKRILMIKINSKKLKTEKNNVLKLIERYFTNIIFFTNILPYLQFLYTIREISSEKIYSKFLTSFLSSPQYKMYNQNYDYINRVSRWCNVLLDIIIITK
jgi:hypothetical protein